MSLLNKIRNKYQNPEVEIVELNKDDILTSSGEIPVAKLSPEEMVEESNKKRAERENERKFVEFGSGNVVDVYPDGVPLEVLKLIEFKYFGAMLKQEYLLPPSYDRNPVKVKIDQVLDKPRVVLTFQSTTNKRERTVSIYGYSVAYSINRPHSLKSMEIHPLMIGVWRRFAGSVMWAWERGYNYALVGPEKNIATYRKPRVNETTIEELHKIETKYQNKCNDSDI
ncbi:MAG: hypothetical protein J6Q13_02540 [Clostridia bacterium]|nr:hypothetical protein [Clostridia bacterium]